MLPSKRRQLSRESSVDYGDSVVVGGNIFPQTGTSGNNKPPFQSLRSPLPNPMKKFDKVKMGLKTNPVSQCRSSGKNRACGTSSHRFESLIEKTRYSVSRKSGPKTTDYYNNSFLPSPDRSEADSFDSLISVASEPLPQRSYKIPGFSNLSEISLINNNNNNNKLSSASLSSRSDHLSTPRLRGRMNLEKPSGSGTSHHASPGVVLISPRFPRMQQQSSTGNIFSSDNIDLGSKSAGIDPELLRSLVDKVQRMVQDKNDEECNFSDNSQTGEYQRTVYVPFIIAMPPSEKNNTTEQKTEDFSATLNQYKSLLSSSETTKKLLGGLIENLENINKMLELEFLATRIVIASGK